MSGMPELRTRASDGAYPESHELIGGLTKREAMAKDLLPGIIASSPPCAAYLREHQEAAQAAKAVRMADHLISALNRKK